MRKCSPVVMKENLLVYLFWFVDLLKYFLVFEKIFITLMYREIALQEAGFHDIYKRIKLEENEKALKLLPGVLEELDACGDDEARWELLWRGVCAANIFDLGAAHTTEMYHKVNDCQCSFPCTYELYKSLERSKLMTML